MTTRNQTNTDSVQTLSGKQLTAPIVAGGSLFDSLLNGCLAVANPTVPLGLATMQYVDQSGGPVPPGTILVDCETSGLPASPPQIANKKYVDDAIVAALAGLGGPAVEIGTPIVVTGWTLPTTITQAHGLSGEPDYVNVTFECLTVDEVWVPGDIVYYDSSLLIGASVTISRGSGIMVDAANFSFYCGQLVLLLDKDTGIGDNITITSSWRLTATPYRFL